MENGKLGEHVMQLQGQIMELEKAIENDQAYYKEQMQHA
jgi:peptidoglycan hydrolase CwlO-like protein